MKPRWLEKKETSNKILEWTSTLSKEDLSEVEKNADYGVAGISRFW